MHFKSKRTTLLLLAITAILFSRALFLFFNDPEGPNLLVVVGTAVIVFFLSLSVYISKFSMIGLKKLLLAIFIQIVLVVGLYFCLS